MNARIFFGLTIAVLLGLGVAVVAKYTGLFNKKPTAPPPEAKQIQVVVARMNLYKGYGINNKYVQTLKLSVNDPRIKDLKPESYFKVLAATFDRVPLRNISAGEILLHDDLSEQKFPEPVVAPQGMVSVNVEVLKENAVGGTIRPGERVNVVLTSKITPPGGSGTPVIRSAVLAHNVEVLTVGNRLVNTIEALVAVKAGQKISYTVAATPYRAALIEQAGYHGTISLQNATLAPAGTDAIDKVKSDQFNRGLLTVGSEDIAELLQVKAVKPAPQPVVRTTLHFQGVGVVGQDRFDENGNRIFSLAGQTGNNNTGGAPASLSMQPPSKTQSLGVVPAAGSGEACESCAKPPR